MCFGPFKRICHWGPLTAIGIIKLVTGATIHCSGMWWPSTRIGGFFNTLCFMSLSALTLYNLLSAMFNGPGFLPLNWKPENLQDCQYLQLCGICKGYKAPRSHHCRKCGRCVKKMDHHCPWINNCVGWANHANFTYFLFFAVVGSFHASIVLTCSLYRGLYRNYYIHYRIPNVPIVHLGFISTLMIILALGFAIGVVIAVGMLLYIQIRGIIRNRTAIEDWIVEKAKYRQIKTKQQFIYPYNLGIRQNLKQVLTLNGQPVGDGIHWIVIEGCDQYSLTIEQIKQKYEKRHNSRLYRVIKPVSGYWFPIIYGIKVCCDFPCSDEPRLKLNVDDMLQVTRWKTYWVYGEKLQPELTEEELVLSRKRGWVPKPCVINATTTTTTISFETKKTY